MARKNAAGPGVNPFVYSRPLSPEDIIDREDEARRLVSLAEGGHYALVYGPRRFGKTSLILKVQADAEREAGLVPVFVDLSDVLTLRELAVRVERAYRALRGPVQRHVGDLLTSLGVNLSLGIVGVEAQLRRDPAADPMPALHALLDLPVGVMGRTGRRALVVFDEFQAVMDIEGADGLIRSHIQHHGESASYIFAGSEPSLLRSLFEDRARPLYGQAEPLQLGRLPLGETATYIQARFDATSKSAGDVLGPLLASAAGHPQRVMLLAHRLWDATPRGATASPEILEEAVSATLAQVDPELRALWSAVGTNERRVLVALASGLSPYESEALKATGLKRASSAQRAVTSLDAATIVEQHRDGGIEILDPLLVLWLRRGPAAALSR